MRRARVALGFRVHTGWAAMVATAGSPSVPEIVARTRVEMIAGHSPEAPPFVYHAAAKLPLADAERLVRASLDEARTRARAAVAAAVRELAARGYEVVGSGVIVGNRTPPSSLEKILGAHPLIHVAEGALFAGAVAAAAEACELPVTRIPAAELVPRAGKLLALSETRLRTHVTAVGRAAGRPWAADQKESFLAALLALAAR